MDDLDFIVDTTATDDKELLKAFSSPFPVFSGSKFSLAVESGDEEPEDEADDDEYFGRHADAYKSSPNLTFFILGLPSPPLRIRDALEKCPIKVEYFKKDSPADASDKERKIHDKLFNALDDYLSELRPKKYSFVTDGIETKKDITRLGMSGNQLKKANRVS